MSMMGEFREISSSLLTRLKADTSLTESVILADFVSDPDASDIDILLNAMPPKQREAMRELLETLTPERRGMVMAQARAAATDLRAVAPSASAPGHDRSGRLDGLGERISIEKAWHGVHFLLTGRSEDAPGDLGQAILGGEEIGDELGYGPARYLDPDTVERVAIALAEVSDEDVRARYNVQALVTSRIYPGGWEDLSNLEWLLQAFREIRMFYRGVADRGNAILLYLT